MPKWGLSMKEGSILKWIKSNGDNISKGDMILEIETEKVVNEMESPEDGKILKICVNEGDTVPVGSLIAVCGKKDASDDEIDSFIDSSTASEISELTMDLDEYIEGGSDSVHKQLREGYGHIPKPQARKIKVYLYGILEDAWRYSHDRRPGRRKKQTK